jgi:serine phosphatase RsbU (regulator of sigma subunit)
MIQSAKSNSNIWASYSRMGVKPDMPDSLQKLIIICNQMCMAFAPLIFIILYLNIYVQKNMLSASFTGGLLLILMLCPFLNKIGWTTFTRTTLCIIIPLEIMTITLIPKLFATDAIPVGEYFRNRFYLLTCIILPLLLLNHRKETFVFVFSLTFDFLCMALYDPIHSFFGVGIENASLSLKNFSLINASGIISWLIILGSFLFFKNTGSYYEYKLIKANENLLEKQNEIEQQNHEIKTQNEELHQYQEEITAQRDAIELKNRQLEEIHKQITSSIQAAQLIQMAMLPHKSKIERVFPSHFIIFKPKDVVSGDFYWVDKIGTKIFIIVIDCTGHGVPGAFMSLIGNTLLDKIIRVWNIHQPSEIILQLHNEINRHLAQEESGSHYGMDASFVSLDAISEFEWNLEFSGAKSDIWLLKPQSPKIEILKGSRRSIGGNQNISTPFTQKSVIIPKSTLLYIGTDGFADQNDVCRRRFGEVKLMEILIRHSKTPLTAQKEYLTQELNDFMQNTTQRDDITMLGVEL